MAFLTAMMISLCLNVSHRYHLKSYLFKHYHELESKNIWLTEESNQKLKALINFDKRPLQLIIAVFGALIMFIGIIAHLSDYFTVWEYTWPAFIIFEGLYFFSYRQYFRENKSMKASMSH